MPGLRHRRFTLALSSAYVAILCTAGYSFLLVPLSLAHVSLAILGLWFLALQACRYLELLDLGISGASLRLISQVKSDREAYRKMMATSFVVQIFQGTLISLLGTLGATPLSRLLVTNAEDQTLLHHFIFWIFLLNGVRLALRIFPNLLRMNQSQHLLNWLNSLGILLNLAVLVVALSLDCGPSSFLFGFATEWLVQTLGPLFLVLSKKDLEHHLEWGTPNWKEAKTLSRFGLSIFQINSFRFILESAPLLLAGRFFGPEASALWSITARAGICLRDLLSQIHISAAPAFYDLLAKGERLRMNQAFTRLAVISLSSASLLLAMFAVWDSSFVSLWTSGKCLPPIFLPFLIALLLWLQIWNAWSVEASLTLLKTRLLSFAFVQELGLFVLGFFLLRSHGLPGLALSSILASLISSFPRGFTLLGQLWDSRSLGRPIKQLLAWGALVFLGLLSATLFWQALIPAPNLPSFIAGVVFSAVCTAGAWAFWLGPKWLLGLRRSSSGS